MSQTNNTPESGHSDSPAPFETPSGALVASTPKAVVIGAGFGGLSAALRLRAKGYAVEMFDRAPRAGGRAQVFERGGFRHDAGPTVITAPFLLEELFDLFGKSLSDYVRLVPLDLWYRFRYPDGDRFDYGGTVEDTLREIRRISEKDADGYLRLLDHSERIFDVGFTALADQPFHDPRVMAAQVPALIRLENYRTVWQLIAKYLKHPKIRQAFSIQPLLVGGNPFETTCIYNLIHFLERKWGVHFAMGGTGALVDGLVKLAREEGIGVHLNTTVDEIQTENGRAIGVTLEGGRKVSADLVVSNADPMHLYDKMVPRKDQPATLRTKHRTGRLSMGLYVLYFGTTRPYPDVAHHTIWLGPRYKELLKEIFHGKTMPKDFSLYAHRPTATDPSFAPPGCESFYVLCPVPNLRADIDWSVEGSRLRDRIVEALDQSMLPGLKDSIVEDFWMTPADFQTNYLSAGGAGFSIAPYFTQSAYFRFHNRSEGLRNLYLVGAGTHPGAGVPGVISSAKVLEHLIPPASEFAAAG